MYWCLSGPSLLLLLRLMAFCDTEAQPSATQPEVIVDLLCGRHLPGTFDIDVTGNTFLS